MKARLMRSRIVNKSSDGISIQLQMALSAPVDVARGIPAIEKELLGKFAFKVEKLEVLKIYQSGLSVDVVLFLSSEQFLKGESHNGNREREENI